MPGVRAHRYGRFCGVLAACLSLTVCRCVCLVHVAALLRHLFWRTPLLLPLSSALCLLRHRRPGLCGATRFNFHPQQTQLQLAVSKHAINRRAIFFGSSRHTSFVLVAESQDARGPVLWGKSRPFCAHQSFFGRNVCSSFCVEGGQSKVKPRSPSVVDTSRPVMAIKYLFLCRGRSSQGSNRVS